jgi:hypothetical protein
MKIKKLQNKMVEISQNLWIVTTHMNAFRKSIKYYQNTKIELKSTLKVKR